MIVRILGEGQYELTGSAEAKVRSLDEQLLRHLEAGDEDAFREDFTHVLRIVRGDGRRLPDDAIHVSDFVLPSQVPSLEEAKALFEGPHA